MSYPIPAADAQALLEIKKSRFIAQARYTPDRAAAMAFWQAMRDTYPDARHHCWAYLLGDPKQPSNAAMSDDGEPSGTAGKPILNVLQHRGVGDVTVVVIRYFGGIKLGAGGLVRAYSAAAQQVMEQLSVVQRVARFGCRLACDFGQEHSLRHWLGLQGGNIEAVAYGAAVTLTVQLPVDTRGALAEQLAMHGWRLLDEAP